MVMGRILQRVILPRRTLIQPIPFIHEGGDCAACVLGGIMGFSSVEDFYKSFPDMKARSTSWSGCRQALYGGLAEGLLEALEDEAPIWKMPTALAYWGYPSWLMPQKWFSHLMRALRAGHYGIAFVRHDRQGPGGDPDHVVLVAGAEEVSEPHPRVENAEVVTLKVLISDSSTTSPSIAEEWIEVEDFLRTRGGFNLLLARPGEADDL